MVLMHINSLIFIVSLLQGLFALSVRIGLQCPRSISQALLLGIN